MAKHIYIALSPEGTPIAQRTTERSYGSASSGGGSFSKDAPNPNHPLRVQLVTKALEWVLTIAMSDGTKHVEKSKAGSFGRKYRVRASYVGTDGAPRSKVMHYFDDRAGFDAYAAREAAREQYPTTWTFEADGHGEVTLKNWPQS